MPFTIQLHQLQFFSFHGLYEEERILGAPYEVNIEVSFPGEAAVTTLEQTVDYVTIYEITRQQMSQPTPLLETVTQNITEAIHQYNTQITGITINIKKLHPPIENFQGSVGVSYTKKF